MNKNVYVAPEWELLDIFLEQCILSVEGQIDDGTEQDYGEL